jgi:2-polyprenyl-3-methyl-5-hydroxy-6-metoxy-1,4-benzoquinol methylase
MDFGATHIAQLQAFGARFHQVRADLPTDLSQVQGQFDFIHAAHLIEHIPKHDLLENVDAIFHRCSAFAASPRSASARC